MLRKLTVARFVLYPQLQSIADTTHECGRGIFSQEITINPLKSQMVWTSNIDAILSSNHRCSRNDCYITAKASYLPPTHPDVELAIDYYNGTGLPFKGKSQSLSNKLSTVNDVLRFA